MWESVPNQGALLWVCVSNCTSTVRQGLCWATLKALLTLNSEDCLRFCRCRVTKTLKTRPTLRCSSVLWWNQCRLIIPHRSKRHQADPVVWNHTLNRFCLIRVRLTNTNESRWSELKKWRKRGKMVSTRLKQVSAALISLATHRHAKIVNNPKKSMQRSKNKLRSSLCRHIRWLMHHLPLFKFQWEGQTVSTTGSKQRGTKPKLN